MKGEMGSIGGLLKQTLAHSGDKAHIYPILRTLDNCLRGHPKPDRPPVKQHDKPTYPH